MYQKIFSKKFHKNERGQKVKRGKIVINKIYHFTAFLVMALSRSASVAVFSEDNNGVFTIDDYTQSIKDAHEDDVVDSFCQSVVFLAELEGPFNDNFDQLPNLPEIFQFPCTKFMTDCIEKDLIHQIHLEPIKEKLEREKNNYTAFIYFLFAIFARKAYVP